MKFQTTILLVATLLGLMAGSLAAKATAKATTLPRQDQSKKGADFETIIHTLIVKFYNITSLKDVVNFLSMIETSDTVCDSQSTYYLYDVLPIVMRFGIMKKAGVSVDMTHPTNWNSLSTTTQETLLALAGSYLPINLNTCISASRVQDLLCTMFGSLLQKKLQTQINFVYNPSSSK